MEEELTFKSFLVFMKSAKSVQERIKHEMSKYNLGLSDFSVLDALYHNGKQNIQQIISNQVFHASSTMTYIIDKLENKGWINRIDCHEDGRVVYVSITEQGRLLMEKVMPHYRKVIQDIFQEINIEEKKMMISMLNRVDQKESLNF